MPIRTYVSSAWQDIKDLKSTVNGASETSEDARIYVNGAWESVWSSLKNIFVFDSTKDLHTTTKYTPSDDKLSLEFDVTCSNNEGYLYFKLTPPPTGEKTSYSVSFKLTYSSTPYPDETEYAVGFAYTNNVLTKAKKGISKPAKNTTYTIDITSYGGSAITELFIYMKINGYMNWYAGNITDVTIDGEPCGFE